MRESSPLIEIRSLAFSYGKFRALDGISLTARAGEVFALLGRNGAGKSTAIGCALGQLQPSDGAVRIAGRDPWRHRARLMSEIGVVPERPDAPPGTIVGAIADFYRRLYRAYDREFAVERLFDYGISTTAQFGRLSRGQRSQVMLTLALACRPKILIMDDPTLGLDAVARRSVFDELIGEIAEHGTTVFLTSHDLAGIEGLADRVAILDQGRLILEEDAESLRLRFRKLRFPQLDAEAAHRRVRDLRPLAVGARAWGAEAIVAGFHDKWTLSTEASSAPFEVSAMTLEEIFIAATQEKETV